MTVGINGPNIRQLMELTEILDIDALQKLQDAFAVSNEVASTIADTSGTPITHPSNHTAVCKIIRSTEKGLARCIESGRVLGLRSIQRAKPISFPCLSIGFIDAAAPIVIDGNHIANWLIGQNCIGDVTAQRVADYAKEIGADAERLVDAFTKMPKLPRRKFDAKLQFLHIMAGQISSLGYHNMVNSDLVTRLRRSEAELRGYKAHLEKLVDQRTQELQSALESIKLLSETDALTGCFNRGYLNTQLSAELKRTARYARELSVILCDIDHFKRINDTYGHQCGDYVLVQTVKIIQQNLRSKIDWVARYGGEEFVIVMPETGLHVAAKAAERIRQYIRREVMHWHDKQLQLTLSLGVAHSFGAKKSEEKAYAKLLARADKALYRAKKGGRNRVITEPDILWKD